MRNCLIVLTISILAGPFSLAQTSDRLSKDQNMRTVIGPRNIPLHDGAEALLAGRDKEGVRLTHEGLEFAQGNREEEAALSNLCAGYIRLNSYTNALKYCELLLARNNKSWRGYNNRAVIYIKTKQWEKAKQDLMRGEQLNPNARTLKIARAMYMDAVHPVAPEVEIDDRKPEDSEEEQ